MRLCRMCNRTKGEHKDGKFCEGCWICKRPKSDHRDGKYCENGLNNLIKQDSVNAAADGGGKKKGQPKKDC